MNQACFMYELLSHASRGVTSLVVCVVPQVQCKPDDAVPGSCDHLKLSDRLTVRHKQ